MKIGICLPYMKAGISREDYLAWFRAVDEGPFHSISCGERVHGPTYDMRVLLSAAAIATQRVEITPTLYVLPMHNADPCGQGSGHSGHSYPAAGSSRLAGRATVAAKRTTRPLAPAFQGRYGRMDQARWRPCARSGAGEEDHRRCRRHRADPHVQRRRVRCILAGAMGPKSIARCSQWADADYTPGLATARHTELQNTFNMADAGLGASRPNRNALSARRGFWYTLADEGQRKLYDYVYEYLAIAGPMKSPP